MASVQPGLKSELQRLQACTKVTVMERLSLHLLKTSELTGSLIKHILEEVE